MSEFVEYCGICGVALSQYEICGDVSGTYINFIERRSGAISIALCEDCQNKILEIIEGGMEKAVARRLSIEGQEPRGFTKKARAKWDKDRKDDDGYGGIRPVHPP